MRANRTTQNYAEIAPSRAAFAQIPKALIGRVMRVRGALPEGLAHIQTTPAPCVQSLEPTR